MRKEGRMDRWMDGWMDGWMDCHSGKSRNFFSLTYIKCKYLFIILLKVIEFIEFIE